MLKKTDWWLLCSAVACSVYGLVILWSMGVMFYGSGASLVKMQTVAVLLGVGCALVISFIDYHVIAACWKIIAPLALLLVGLTFVVGLQAVGTDDRAWLEIGGVSLQPSEILKIAFILTFSVHLERVQEHMNKPLSLLLLCVHGAFPVLLIHFQGDDGTALIFAFIFVCMLVAAGLSWKYILAALLASPLLLAFVWFFVMDDMHRRRIWIVFQPELDPLGDGYQAMQGKITLGSGQMLGRGLFNESLRSVPAMKNDFIFAYIGQVLGFLGCLAVVLLLTVLAIRCLLVARKSNDFLGYLICVGVFAIFAFQAIVNMGMSLSVTPVIGITLPLFSSGGTSVTITYLSIGLVLSVWRNRRSDMFETTGRIKIERVHSLPGVTENSNH